MTPDQVLTVLLHLHILYDNEVSTTSDIFNIPAEFRHELLRHECYPMLIDNVESVLPQLSPKVASALYATLGRLGEPITSGLMQKLCIRLQKSQMDIDPQSFSNFAVGLSYINPLLDGDIFVSKGNSVNLSKIRSRIPIRI